jgi:hypothetical protein
MAQVHMFARSWVSWIGTHGGIASVVLNTYLDKAEPFARAFLLSGGDMGQQEEGQRKGLFQVWDDHANIEICVCIHSPGHSCSAARHGTALS